MFSLERQKALIAEALRMAERQLNGWIERPVRLELQRVLVANAQELFQKVAVSQDPTIGLLSDVSGVAPARFLVTMPLQEGFRLARMISSRPVEDENGLNERGRSVIQETGNILVSSFCSGIDTQLDAIGIHSQVQFFIEIEKVLMQETILSATVAQDQFLLCEIAFLIAEKEMGFRFFYLPLVTAQEEGQGVREA